MADDECRQWWEELALGYTEVPGHPRLRNAIAQLYGGIAADQVAVFAGAQEAVFVFMNVALGPGDHAVVVWPSYQSLFEVARAVGAEVTLLQLRQESGWALDVQELKDSIRPNTRAIVINFPHSPTGAHLDQSSFDDIVAIARERGTLLFSDEVYRYAEFDDGARLKAAADAYDGGVSLGVMSKAFGLAGLRIGWIATRDTGLLARLRAFKHYLTICNSAASEVLATIALRNRSSILARNRKIVAGNLARLDRFFDEWQRAFTWVRPRAGNVAFPRLQSEISIEQFASELVQEEGVLILPGSVFQVPGNHFRIGFGRRNFQEALERFEKFARARLG